MNSMDAHSIAEFAREQFVKFVSFLGAAPGSTEAENSRWNRKFRELAQDPKGTDLLYYPDPGQESDEDVVAEVERYRRENGMLGFKDSDF